ncbi:recombinase family protein [Agrobacterium tumefaciens]|uniref:recombinase family protein n=1 Tax=Agrobacterium tumefaciens TaxID=358 RepID=UPI003013B86D
MWSATRCAKLNRAERRQIMALARARQIDAVLVTELSRWRRSTRDLLNTLQELESWRGFRYRQERHGMRPVVSASPDAGDLSAGYCGI